MKLAKTSSGDINFLVNALAYPNGTVYNEEAAETAYTTGRLYTTIYVRHWDTWLTKQRYNLFGGTLKSANSSYTLSGSVKNLMSGLNWTVTQPETPVQPFGDSGDYDITPDGSLVAFLTKAPQLPKANITASYVYLVPFDKSQAPKAINGPGSQAAAAGHLGASGAPRFSPDGTKLSYFQMDGIYYESDRNKLYVAGIAVGCSVASWTPVAADWDRSPDNVDWSIDSTAVYASTADLAEEKIFYIPINASASYKPSNLTTGDYVIGYHVLPDSTLLIASSTIYSSINIYSLSPSGSKRVYFTANTVDPELAGLGPEDISQFYFTGSLGIQMQAWIVYPEGFSPNKTYPLAFIVHGGPQGDHANSWSTRWNFKVWADQGYVVVAPNPTGSTSFGQRLTDLIQNQWGGYPYDDLVAAWNYVDANLSYVDTEHGIEAGASYGGYMTNWIQGHDLGRKFKALVTHDGVTSTLSDYGSEELWFIQHDENGTLWDDRANYERWDPAAHVKNFSTPHFVVHNSMDYRLPESEGITMFNFLQERGVPSRFLSFPDENHWVLDQENSLFWHTEIFNWINHWSGVGGALDDNAIGA